MRIWHPNGQSAGLGRGKTWRTVGAGPNRADQRNPAAHVRGRAGMNLTLTIELAAKERKERKDEDLASKWSVGGPGAGEDLENGGSWTKPRRSTKSGGACSGARRNEPNTDNWIGRKR